MVTISTSAQYSTSNTLFIQEIVSWHPDHRGIYHPTYGEPLQMLLKVQKQYAYNKRSQQLYVVTDYSNVVITLKKEMAKIIKKDKSIQKLSDDELKEAIEKQSEELKTKFEAMNQRREHAIEDSIRYAKEEAIRKAKLDSIEREVRRKAELEAQKLKQDVYRAEHDYRDVPYNVGSLYCTDCEKEIKIDDIVKTYIINDDSIYYYTLSKWEFGVESPILHVSEIPTTLKESSAFTEHYEAFKDSLKYNISIPTESIVQVNEVCALEAIKEIQKKAPWGYIDKWSWDTEYNHVTLKLAFQNYNKKTLKYLEVFFKITNDVNDTRLTGSVRGTGPVEFLDGGEWNWDDTNYYVFAGDASKMKITKLVITYMDGTKKVLVGNQIMFNTDDDEDRD